MLERTLASAALAAICLALTATAAWAHGDIASAVPPMDAKVKKVPKHIAVQFTEAPTKQAVVTVADGCRRRVSQSLTVSGDTAHVTLAPAQPGRFDVKYRIVSDVDGHPTRGGYSFTVRGKKDCSAPEPADEGEPGNTAAPDAGGTDQAAADGEPADEHTSILVWIGVGTAAAATIALVVRGRS